MTLRISPTSLVALWLAGIGLSWSANAWSGPSSGELYHDFCSVCHGDAGDGRSRAQQGLNPPPRDFTNADSARVLTRERMIASIAQGRPGTAMAGWSSRLNEEQIAGLADFISDNFVRPAAATDAGKPGALLPGAKLFADNCSVCHGDDGTGAVWGSASLVSPPRNFTTEESRRELSLERMIRSVTYGRPGTPMAAFGGQLSSDEIAQVVGFVRRQFMGIGDEASAPSAAALAGRADDAIPAGDYRRGEVLYLPNCTTCHGISGAGDGPRAYFIVPRPRNFLESLTRQATSRETLFDGIKHGVTGREMPAWGKVLDDQQIADLAEYVFVTFIEPDN